MLREGNSMIGATCVLVVVSALLSSAPIGEQWSWGDGISVVHHNDASAGGIAQGQSSGSKSDTGKRSTGSSTKSGQKKSGTRTQGSSGSSKAPAATKPSTSSATKPPSSASSKAKPSQDGRPQFAPLFDGLMAEYKAVLDPRGAEALQTLVDAAKAADASAPALQVKFAQEAEQLLSASNLLEMPREREGMPAKQRKAIQEWMAKQREADVPASSQFMRSLERGVQSLEAWIAADAARQGTTLQFSGKSVGRLRGLRSIPWGPIEGWTDDVVALKFDDGVTFERQSKVQSLPLIMRPSFVASSSEWPAPLPPLDALPGSLDILQSSRPLEGTEGVQIIQRILVVDGSLEAVLTVIGSSEQDGDEGSLMAAASSQWEAVEEDLGEKAEVLEVANIGQALRSVVTWRSDEGVASALAVNEVAADQPTFAKLLLRSPEYLVGPKTCTVLQVTDKIREGISAWTFDSDEITAEEKRALIPDSSQCVVMVEMIAHGADKTKYCKPNLTLADSEGRKYEDVGHVARMAVIQGVGGNGTTIPQDLTPARAALILRSGQQASHGERTYVFYVPADAKNLSLSLEGCESSVQLPELPRDKDSYRVPIDSRSQLPFADSVARSDEKTACAAVRQWSAGIISRAEAAKAAAEQKAVQKKADEEAASKQEAADNDRKRKKAFD